MNRQLKRIFNDIDVLGINGGYSVEELLTPQDCRMLKYEIERLNKKYIDYRNYIRKESGYQTKECLVRERDLLKERIDKAIEKINWLGKEIEEDEGISWQIKYCDEIIDILKGSDN